MFSRMALVFRVVLKRVVADRAVILAGLATVLLSTILVSAGPIYAEAVTIRAFARAMENAPAGESGISIRAGAFPEDADGLDRLVIETVAAALRPTDAVVTVIFGTDSHDLRLGPDDGDTVRAAVWHVDRIEQLATLDAGSWPSDEDTGAMAVPTVVAQELGIETGDLLDMASRTDPGRVATTEVVGIYSINDPDDTVWFADPFVVEGTYTTGGSPVYGPFIASRRAILEGLGGRRVDVRWRVSPEFTGMRPGAVEAFRAGITRLETDLNARLESAADVTRADATTFDISTRLPAQLDTIGRSLSVTSSTVLAVLLQLSLLAGYALVLTARLIVGTRTTETALARSRGGSPAQLTTAAGLEGLLLAGPAALAGPALAAVLLRGLNHFGPLASIGLAIDPKPNVAAYILAAVAAAIAFVSLIWPAYRAARAFPDPEGRARRQSTRSPTQRLGVDLGLILLVVVAVWQLEELGPRVTATVRGRFGVDPLLLAAPVLGLVAGVVLALRVIPILARIAERLVASRAPAVPVLASWQIARRPARYARSALLLMMAVALGVFASSFSTSWLVSQSDQASHRVGADLRFLASNAGDAYADIHMRAALEGLSGVVDSLPVAMIRGPVAPNRQARIVLLDAAAAESVVRLRTDLKGDFGPLMQQLVDGRVHLPSIGLPGEPSSLRMTWEAVEEQAKEELPGCGPSRDLTQEPYCFEANVAIVVEDGHGQLHRLDAGQIHADTGPVSLTVDLLGPGGEGPRYPLSVVALEVESGLSDFEQPLTAILALHSLGVVAPTGTETTVPLSGSEWSLTAMADQSAFVHERPTINWARQSGPGLAVRVSTGLGFGSFYSAITPVGPGLARTFPVVTTKDGLEDGVWELGARVRLRALSLGTITSEIVGTIEGFPGLDPTPPLAILVDLPTYQALRYVPGQAIPRSEQYWLATEYADDATAAALAMPPFRGRGVVSRDEVVAGLTSDPVALGTVGAFAIGFVAAAVFAAIGFVISALVSARERLAEFSLLHALGLSRRQLGSWLLLEQAVLVLLGLGMGTIVGWGLSQLLLPLITLTQDGSPAFPDLIVVHPWATILSFQVAMLAGITVLVTLLATSIRRRGFGSALRFGDDS